MSSEASTLRMEIHAYISMHPAAHILEIAQAFDLAHPTVMYHLDLLEDEGYVVSSIWGKRRAHFDSASHYTAWEREILALLAIDEARAIVDLIAARPGTFPREIAQTLGISDTTVKRYVPELLRLNVVSEVDGGFRRRLALSRAFLRRGRALFEKVPLGSNGKGRLEVLLPRAATESLNRVETRSTVRDPILEKI